MNKIIVALVLLFGISLQAQLKVSDTKKLETIGEYKLLGTSYAKIAKDNDLCIFTYRDEKFTKIDTYKYFFFKYSDLDALYDMFYNLKDIEKGTEKTVDLENGDKLLFSYQKMLGKPYVVVTHVSKAGVIGALRSLNDNQTKKVFGK